MESRISKAGIIDFFLAFSSDTSVDSGRVNMSDLKSSDWEGVSDKVKKELLIESPKRIQNIFKSIVTKITDTLNVKTTSIRRDDNVNEKLEIKEEEQMQTIERGE